MTDLVITFLALLVFVLLLSIGDWKARAFRAETQLVTRMAHDEESIRAIVREELSPARPNPEAVSDLRRRTGLGMWTCIDLLHRTRGDVDAAIALVTPQGGRLDA